MWASYAMALMLPAATAASAGAGPCGPASGIPGYVVVVEGSGSFVHCRDGELTDTQPVSGEKVTVKLPAVDPREPYRFHLIDPTKVVASHHRRLFRHQLETVESLRTALLDLSGATDMPDLAESTAPATTGVGPVEAATAPTPAGGKPHVAQIPLPQARVAAPSLDRAAALQRQFSQTANPGFAAAVRTLRRLLPSMSEVSADVDRACRDQKVPAGPLQEAIAQRCGQGPGAAFMAALKPVEDGLATFVAARHAARDALLDLAGTSPTSEASAATAVAQLGKAIEAAHALEATAPPASRAAEDFAHEVQFLQIALSISPSSAEGSEISLGRLSAAGLFEAPVVYEINVSREPSALFDLGGAEPPEGAKPQTAAETGNEILVDRVQPVEHRYFNLELAMAYSSGLPDHPELSGRLGAQTLVPVKTQGFSGGVLASLEPLMFTSAEHAWAGMLRFPTVIVPFTLNPLTNYFVGGGIGWNNVGSINVGAHLAVSTVPAVGTPYGTEFTTTPILLDHVTQTGSLAGGYFVSASLDVLGIIHLFFEQRHPVIEDAFSGSTAQR